MQEKKLPETMSQDYNDSDDEINMKTKSGKIGAALLFSTFAENSSIVGVPSFQRSKEVFRMFFWLCVVLAGVGCISWQLVLAINKYLDYGTTTSVEEVLGVEQVFPAVTICNLCPIDIKAKNLDKSLYDTLMSMQTAKSIETNNGTTESTATDSGDSEKSGTEIADPASDKETKKRRKRSVSNDKDSQNDNKKLLFGDDIGDREKNSDMENFEKIQEKISQLSAEKQYLIGFKLDDILFSCTYNTFTCNISEFQRTYDTRYGNCYTYNARTDTTMKSNQVGPTYGLILEVNIKQEHYAAATAESAGVRVVIHSPDKYPFPQDTGVNASPGSMTSIAIKKKMYSRPTDPYGSCKTYDVDTSKSKDGYYGMTETSKYSRESCMKSCLQRRTMSSCKCYRSSLPNSGSAFTNIQVNDTHELNGNVLRKCNESSSSTDYDCTLEIKAKYIKEEIECGQECPIQCEEEEYEMFISSASWPSKSKSDIMSRSLSNKGLVSMDSGGPEFASENLVRVEIYYKSLSVEKLTEKAAYEINNLMSDFGGIMGLWLGLSVASIFEIIELFVDIFVYIIRTSVISCKGSSIKPA